MEYEASGRVPRHADLDLIFEALLNGKVPPLWLKTYPSLKPLGAWTRDLLQRIDQLARWVEDTYPAVYWLSGFTYPTGFLTAVLQTTARKNSIPIDTLSFEFGVLNADPAEVAGAPKEGVYVHGVYLEGAGWDQEEVRLLLGHCGAALCSVAHPSAPAPAQQTRPVLCRSACASLIRWSSSCPCRFCCSSLWRTRSAAKRASTAARCTCILCARARASGPRS